jgi:hypothetical protein
MVLMIFDVDKRSFALMSHLMGLMDVLEEDDEVLQ